MLTLFVKLVRLIFFVALTISTVSLSGCSVFSSKPAVIDTQAEVLGPISSELQKAYGDALALMRDEEFEAAETQLLEITSKFPAYAGPWSNLAIAQSKQEKFEQAVLSVEKSLLQDKNFCPSVSFKGILLRELGKFKMAKEQYLAALVCDPNDTMTLYNLGVLSDLYLHDNVTALSYYQQYLASQGDQQDETVKSWVVDLKRRLPAEVENSPAQSIDVSVDTHVSEPQLAGEE